MPDDAWNDQNAWAEPDRWNEGEADWEQDLERGDARYAQGYSMSPPQSGLGIASLVLSVIAGVMIVVSFIGARFIAVQNPNLREDDPRIIGVGCAILAGAGMALVASILGLIGVFQPDRGRTCAVLGVVLAGLEIVGVGGLIVVGLTMG